MSIVPIMYEFEREFENFKKSIVSDDFWFRDFPQEMFPMRSILPLSFFQPQLLWSYPFQHQLGTLPQLDQKEKMTIDKDGFQLTFDVKEFKPNELTVKTVNNFVVIEGKHEERKDDQNFTKKHFSRTYLLPTGYNPDAVDSTISSDGVLSVKIPPPQAAIECKERTVQIKQIGTTYPAIKDKNTL